MVKIHLKEIRKSKNMSQRTLSRKSGVSDSYISEIETGIKIPSVDIICKLARALKCKPCEIFSCDERRR